MKARGAFVLLLAMLVGGCTGSTKIDPGLSQGAAAYNVIPAAPEEIATRDYRIGPLDSVDVNIFGEPELSVKAVQVDASGNIALPLVGKMMVAGKTGPQVADEIGKVLGSKFLRDPQVAVTVSSSVSQKVIVQGEVTEPGVYDIKGRTTLLEALSMAKGETRVASLNQVVVFRNVGGKRAGAVFDVRSIRAGSAPDPEILGNDLVIVGYSGLKGGWRDFLSTAPILNIFRPF